jgi:hypothetical protein
VAPVPETLSSSGAAGSSGEAPAAENRHGPPLVQADTPAVEKNRRVVRGRDRRGSTTTTTLIGAAKGERPLILEEEFALLGEEEAEPRQVDLLFVSFDLGKIRVVSEIRREVLGEPVFHVRAEVAAHIVERRCRGRNVGRDVRGDVGFDLEVPRASNHFETDHGGGHGGLQRAHASFGGRNK